MREWVAGLMAKAARALSYEHMPYGPPPYPHTEGEWETICLQERAFAWDQANAGEGGDQPA